MEHMSSQDPEKTNDRPLRRDKDDPSTDEERVSLAPLGPVEALQALMKVRPEEDQGEDSDKQQKP